VLLVGLTGGLGAGKSTAARMLGQHGAVIVDADELARRALEPGTPGFEQVCDVFGRNILDAEGRIDRRQLAARVFADEGKRRALESITHPEVFRLLAETVESHRGTDHVVVFDAALIVETGFHEAVDVLVVVTAPEEDQVRRVAGDRGMTEDERRILARFFEGDRLTHLPAARSKRLVVLERLALEFEPGERYPEAEVNRRLRRFDDDHSTLRRALVDEGLLGREPGTDRAGRATQFYWRSGGRLA
jgi:dephospho-CoA kinase